MSAILFVAAIVIPPKPDGHVFDAANRITFRDSIAVDAELAQLQRDTGDEMIVYVDRDLPEGTNLLEFTSAVMREWNIGGAKKKGAAFFIFTDAHKMRIVFADGLRDAIPQKATAAILTGIEEPLRRDDVSTAVRRASRAFTTRIRGYERTAPFMPFVYAFCGVLAIVGVALRRQIRRFFGTRGWYNDYDDVSINPDSGSSGGASDSW